MIPPPLRMRPPFLSVLSILILLAGQVHAAFPPKGFVIHEDTESPDGHYAVLVSDFAGEEPEESEIVNRIVDLKTKKSIGKLQFTSYYAHAPLRGLQVHWAPDSTWCVVEQDGRWTFDRLTVVEIQRGALRQTAIEKRVDDLLERELKQQDGSGGGESNVFIRAGADRKVRLRALADNNPKGLDDRKTRCALFQGTYDLGAGKWTITDARSVTEEQNDTLTKAYRGVDPLGRVFSDDDEKAKWLDEQLNAVYGALRLLLPPDRFAAVKPEQIAWLKAQPEDASPKVRSAAWTARIKVLEKLLW